MIKLIATDLDGTLMASDHMTVTKRTINALKEASDKGIKIAIATGRTVNMINMVLDQIPFVDYIIYSNGAGVYDLSSKKTIYRNMMNWELTLKLLEFLDNHPLFYEVYCDGHSNMRTDKEQYFSLKNIPQKFIDELTKDISAYDDLKVALKDKEIEKINIFSLPVECANEVNEFLSTQTAIAITSSIADDIEMTSNSADKGIALCGLCDILNITKDEVMTFGDAGNDIGMLKFASYSYAMANGSNEAKKAAKFQAESNTKDGLAKIVEKVALN